MNKKEIKTYKKEVYILNVIGESFFGEKGLPNITYESLVKTYRPEELVSLDSFLGVDIVHIPSDKQSHGAHVLVERVYKATYPWIYNEITNRRRYRCVVRNLIYRHKGAKIAVDADCYEIRQDDPIIQKVNSAVDGFKIK